MRVRSMLMKPIVLFAVILKATPALAAGSSDVAAGGLGLLSLFGVVNAIVLFFLPFMVWGCLVKLTDIRNDIRGLRKDFAAYRASTQNRPELRPGLTFENAE